MSPSSKLWIINTSIAATLIAILYRYWLVAPALHYLSIGQWHIFAIVVAAACGGVMSLLKIPALGLVFGPMAGLLIGGTWAAWQAPNDVPVSVGAALAAHVESFWGELIVLTVAASIGGFCFTRFARRRTKS